MNSPQRLVNIARDGVSLTGQLNKPPGKGRLPLVIFVHAIDSGKDSPRGTQVVPHLLEAGIATLRFDLSGHGDSSFDRKRKFLDPDPHKTYVADLESVFAWAVAQEEINPDRVGVIGSSFGAFIAARATAEGKVQPKTLVLRGPSMTEEELQSVNLHSLVLVGSEDPLLDKVKAGVDANPLLVLSVIEGATHRFAEPEPLAEAIHQTIAWLKNTLQ